MSCFTSVFPRRIVSNRQYSLSSVEIIHVSGTVSLNSEHGLKIPNVMSYAMDNFISPAVKCDCIKTTQLREFTGESSSCEHGNKPSTSAKVSNGTFFIILLTRWLAWGAPVDHVNLNFSTARNTFGSEDNISYWGAQCLWCELHF